MTLKVKFKVIHAQYRFYHTMIHDCCKFESNGLIYFKSSCANMQHIGVCLSVKLSNELDCQGHHSRSVVYILIIWYIARLNLKHWIDLFKSYCAARSNIRGVFVSRTTKWPWKSRSYKFNRVPWYITGGNLATPLVSPDWFVQKLLWRQASHQGRANK